jgi:serine/threonine-protein kinase
VLAILGVLGSWTYHAIDRSLREMRAVSLPGFVDSEVKAIEIWIAERQRDVARMARDPAVRQVALAPSCDSPAARSAPATFVGLLQDEGFAAWRVLDARGTVIASSVAGECGSGSREAAPAPTAAAPVVWVRSAIRNAAGAPVGALLLGEPAERRLAGILSATQIGATGEAFAFDSNAALLADSRFTRRGAGATPAPRIAAVAVADARGEAKRGTLLEPYENHRGLSAIGSWRWLPEYGMGIAVELGAEEAYAPLAFLNTAFGLLFGALAAAIVAGVAYTYWLRRQIGEARRLGAYTLERKIGEGGMADVFLANHTLLKRPTAVKILKPEKASEQFTARFEREVRLASQLSHPNTVEIYDYGRTDDGLFYFAMEYLDGIDLTRLVRESGPVPVARAIHLLRQVCAGLAEAHGKGLVHRDVKPENIMACVRGGERDVAKILDFGMVKNLAGPSTRDLTRTVKLMGTPLYMAPECFRSPGDVDARADIYSFGAVAFFLLAGRDVFESQDDVQLTHQVLHTDAPRPSTVAQQLIPIELDLLVTACLEKRREDRPQRVEDLIEALDALVAAGHRWSAKEAEAWWSAHRSPSGAPAAGT